MRAREKKNSPSQFSSPYMSRSPPGLLKFCTKHHSRTGTDPSSAFFSSFSVSSSLSSLFSTEGGFKAEPLSPLFHVVTTHPSSLSHSSSLVGARTYLPRSFLLTLAFSPPPFAPRAEDQLECLGVLRVPAIIPRSR